jgi:hypothetical protein
VRLQLPRAKHGDTAERYTVVGVQLHGVRLLLVTLDAGGRKITAALTIGKAFAFAWAVVVTALRARFNRAAP